MRTLAELHRQAEAVAAAPKHERRYMPVCVIGFTDDCGLPNAALLTREIDSQTRLLIGPPLTVHVGETVGVEREGGPRYVVGRCLLVFEGMRRYAGREVEGWHAL